MESEIRKRDRTLEFEESCPLVNERISWRCGVRIELTSKKGAGLLNLRACPLAWGLFECRSPVPLCHTPAPLVSAVTPGRGLALCCSAAPNQPMPFHRKPAL